jgi:hypothetical protein
MSTKWIHRRGTGDGGAGGTRFRLSGPTPLAGLVPIFGSIAGDMD